MKTLLCWTMLVSISVCVPAELLGQMLSLSSPTLSSFPQISAKIFAVDAAGKQISLQTANDIALTLNGTPAVVEALHCPALSEQERTSFVISADISESMRRTLSPSNIRYIDALKNALRTFAELIDYSRSECAVTSFNHFAYLNLELSVRKSSVLSAVDNLSAPLYGGTNYDSALFQPIIGALDVAKLGKHRRTILFFTDGDGVLESAGALQKLQSANATLYVFGLGFTVSAALDKLSKESGGAVFNQLESEQDVVNAISSVFFEVSKQEPCTVVWRDKTDCTSLRIGKFALKSNPSVQGAVQYFIPSSNAASIEVQPNRKDFGDVPQGQSATEEFTVTANKADASITVLSAAPSEFSIVSPATPFVIPAGESRVVTVRFSPSKANTRVVGGFRIERDGCDIFEQVVLLGGNNLFPTSGNGTIRIVSPNGGERFEAGGDTALHWSGILPADTVRLEYSDNQGVSWTTITDVAFGLKHIWAPLPNKAGDKYLVRVSQTNSNRIFDAVLDTVVPTDNGLVNMLVPSPDGTELYATTGNGSVLVYGLDGRKLTLKQTLPVLGGGDNWGLAISSDSRRLAVGCHTGLLVFWEKNNVGIWEEKQQAFGHGGQIWSCAFSPDDVLFASTGFSGDLRIWERDGSGLWQEKQTILPHTGICYSAVFDPTGEFLLTGGADKLVKVWTKNPFTGQWEMLHELTGHTADVRMIALLKNSTTFASVGFDGEALVWQYDSGLLSWKQTHRLSGHTGIAWGCAFSPDGVTLASAGDDRFVSFWKQNFDGAWSLHRRERLHTDAVYSVAFSIDGIYGFSGGRDAVIRVWHIGSGHLQTDQSDAVFSLLRPNVSSDNLDMGNVYVGTAKDSVVVKCIRNDSPLRSTIRSLRLSGGDVADFSIVSRSPEGNSVQGMGSMDVEWRFVPTALGIRKADIEIVAAGDTIYKSIEGVGISKPFGFGTSSLHFGDVSLTQSKDSVLSNGIVNFGTGPLRILRVELEGPGSAAFSFSGNHRDTSFVVTGGSAPLSLRFRPVRVGLTSAVMNVYADGYDIPLSLILSGRGIDSTGIVLQLGNVRGFPGDKVAIPVYLQSRTNTNDRVDGFEAVLRVRADVISSDNRTSEGNVVGEYRYLSYSIDANLLDAKGKIADLPVVLTLGADSLTEITFSDVKPINGNIPIQVVPGIAAVNICRAGGDRLFQSVKFGAGIFIAAEHPFSDILRVRVRTVEMGEHSLEIFNVSGEKVHAIPLLFLEPGEFDVEIPFAGASVGLYSLHLNAPSQTLFCTVVKK